MSTYPRRTDPINDTSGTAALLPPGFPAFDGTQKCVDVDPDLFFPTAGTEAHAAAETERICRGCVFRSPCAEWAIRSNEQGIWGGTTERQRNRIRRRAA